ncbi:MAG: paraslipin [Leptospiraceae bacterium]|nr:paraslipin [Leptospiraceae bacterium]
MLGIIGIIFYTILFLYFVYKFIRAIRIVPNREEYIVERLGKYNRTLGAGFHTLVPFFDRVAYELTLKEEAIDVPAQICITRDNVRIEVDGIIYLQIKDSYKAAYNVTDYRYAVIQLAQTTMRAAFGDLDLDKTFEEREAINAQIVRIVDQAADDWGVDIKRYEIQNITPSREILAAMEAQMTAERDKRAEIARSEGDMTSRINHSEGQMQELINASEGEKQRRINEAEGRAREIEAIAAATAEGLRQVAESLVTPGGDRAMALSLSEDYLRKLQGIARADNRVIIPMNVTDLDGVLDGLGLNPGKTGQSS